MLHENILNQANQQAIAKLSFDTKFHYSSKQVCPSIFFIFWYLFYQWIHIDAYRNSTLGLIIKNNICMSQNQATIRDEWQSFIGLFHRLTIIPLRAHEIRK